MIESLSVEPWNFVISPSSCYSHSPIAISTHLQPDLRLDQIRPSIVEMARVENLRLSGGEFAKFDVLILMGKIDPALVEHCPSFMQND